MDWKPSNLGGCELSGCEITTSLRRLSTPEIPSCSAESSGASPQNPAKDSSAQNNVLIVLSSSHTKIERVQVYTSIEMFAVTQSNQLNLDLPTRLGALESPRCPEDFDALFPVSPPGDT